MDSEPVCESQFSKLIISRYNVSSVWNSISYAVRKITPEMEKKSGKMYTSLTQCVQNIYPVNTIHLYIHTPWNSASTCQPDLRINYVCNFAVKAERPQSRAPRCFYTPGMWICIECDARQPREPRAPSAPFLRRMLALWHLQIHSEKGHLLIKTFY